jgi:hypothetical protein
MTQSILQGHKIPPPLAVLSVSLVESLGARKRTEGELTLAAARRRSANAIPLKWLGIRMNGGSLRSMRWFLYKQRNLRDHVNKSQLLM